MAADCSMCLAYLWLWISGTVTSVGFATDFWILYGAPDGNSAGYTGLTRYCHHDNCQWPWEKTLYHFEDPMPGWYKFCQWFMSFGVVLVLISVVCGMLYICNCCAAQQLFNKIIALFLSVACVLITIVLIVFAYNVHYNRNDFPVRMTTMSWSYFVTVAGVCLLFLDNIAWWLLLLRTSDFARKGRLRKFLHATSSV